jgi:hypothetical protein
VTGGGVGCEKQNGKTFNDAERSGTAIICEMKSSFASYPLSEIHTKSNDFNLFDASSSYSAFVSLLLFLTIQPQTLEKNKKFYPTH